MNAMPLPLPAVGRDRIAADLLLAVMHGDGVVYLEGVAGAGRAALLDKVAAELARLRMRVLRVQGAASGELALAELTAQVAGQIGRCVSSENRLELAFEALTEPGENHSRIALLVDGAETLLPAAFRYINLACNHCPRLRVVLAGPPGLADRLGQQGFGELRQRLTYRLAMSSAPDPLQVRPEPPPCEPSSAASTAPDLTLSRRDAAIAATAADRGRISCTPRPDLWRLAGAGVVASLLLTAWTMNWSGTTAGTDAVAIGVTGTAEIAIPTATLTAAVRSAEPSATPGLRPPASANDAPGGTNSAAASPLPAPAPRPAETEPPALLAETYVAPPPIPPLPPLESPRIGPPKAPPPRPARNGTERLAGWQALGWDWQRCREIDFMAQVGERLTSSEHRFLRNGCRQR